MKVEITVTIAVDLPGFVDPKELDNITVNISEEHISLYSGSLISGELDRNILGYQTTSCDLLGD